MPSGRLDFFYTLRFRLIAWLTLVVVVLIAVTMGVVRTVVWRSLQEEYDQVLREDAVEIRLALHQLYPEKRDQFISFLERHVRGHEYRAWFVQLYDARRELVWESRTPPGLPPPAFPTRGELLTDVGDVRVLEERVDARRPGAPLYLRIGGSREALDADLRLIHRSLLLVGVVVVLLAPVGGFVLAGRATRPLAWIIATTARLQPSNLSERLPVRGTGDELDRLAQTINGMLDRLGSYLDRNRAFVANAAHELRSPLAAIRSSVEVALNRPRPADEYVVLLTDVMEECTRLGSLVNRLLLLAEGDAGRLAAREQAVYLDRVVREAVDMFEAVADAQGVRLTAAALAPAVVPGDEHHVRQVVRNLIDNAIKFSPAPGAVDVALETDAARRQAVLRVADRGAGIPADALPHIFERFYRGDKARPRAAAGRGGYGLGLSICQAIVTALGGAIEVESAPGRGSTFTVRLPLADGPAAADGPPRPA